MRSKPETGNDCDIHANSCVLDTDAKCNGKILDFVLADENHSKSVASCDGTVITDIPVLQERNGNEVEDVAPPSLAAHHIATRSATGRLAKRPRKDLSPARSPPRKIGIKIFCVEY